MTTKAEQRSHLSFVKAGRHVSTLMGTMRLGESSDKIYGMPPDKLDHRRFKKFSNIWPGVLKENKYDRNTNQDNFDKTVNPSNISVTQSSRDNQTNKCNHGDTIEIKNTSNGQITLHEENRHFLLDKKTPMKLIHANFEFDSKQNSVRNASESTQLELHEGGRQGKMPAQINKQCEQLGLLKFRSAGKLFQRKDTFVLKKDLSQQQLPEKSSTFSDLKSGVEIDKFDKRGKKCLDGETLKDKTSQSMEIDAASMINGEGETLSSGSATMEKKTPALVKSKQQNDMTEESAEKHASTRLLKKTDEKERDSHLSSLEEDKMDAVTRHQFTGYARQPYVDNDTDDDAADCTDDVRIGQPRSYVLSRKSELLNKQNPHDRAKSSIISRDSSSANVTLHSQIDPHEHLTMPEIESVTNANLFLHFQENMDNSFQHKSDKSGFSNITTESGIREGRQTATRRGVGITSAEGLLTFENNSSIGNLDYNGRKKYKKVSSKHTHKKKIDKLDDTNQKEKDIEQIQYFFNQNKGPQSSKRRSVSMQSSVARRPLELLHWQSFDPDVVERQDRDENSSYNIKDYNYLSSSYPGGRYIGNDGKVQPPYAVMFPGSTEDCSKYAEGTPAYHGVKNILAYKEYADLIKTKQQKEKEISGESGDQKNALKSRVEVNADCMGQSRGHSLPIETGHTLLVACQGKSGKTMATTTLPKITPCSTPLPPGMAPQRSHTSASIYGAYPPKELSNTVDFIQIPKRINPLAPNPPKRRINSSWETVDRHYENDKRRMLMQQREHTRYHSAWSKAFYGAPAEKEAYRRHFRETLKQQMADKDTSIRQHMTDKVKETEHALDYDRQCRLNDAKEYFRKHHFLMEYRDTNKTRMEDLWAARSYSKVREDRVDREKLRYNPINWSCTLK